MKHTNRLFIKIVFALLFTALMLSIWKSYNYLVYFFSITLALLGYTFTSYILRQNVKYKRELQKNLFIDLNTKLPNRHRLLKDKNHLSGTHDATLIIINIDSFQNTNNFYGHHFGDSFLKAIGQWLSENLPPVECKLYKFEADIYAMLIKASFSEYNLDKYLRKLSLKITKDRILCEDVEVDTTLTIGAVQAKKNLLKLASIACKEAKMRRISYTIYDKNSHKDEEYHYNMTMNHILKEALAKDYVVPFFQPIMNLHTHRIEKFETLMRIRKEDGEFYLPCEFLNIAKHSKLYSKLSMSLIQKAFETFQISSNGFSINLSYLDMTNIVTTTFIIEKLEEFTIGPWVIFEILESDGIENYEAIVNFIDQVKSYGAKIAIDDFGAGYSNFERLTELRVDLIKIDGSLIKNIDKNEEARIIVETIVSFAKKLGISTVAEYVHSRQILECVKEIGIDFAQGYYIGKPAPKPTSILEYAL